MGVCFIISSFIIGKLTNLVFILYFNNSTIRWLSIIVYLLTWPMLFLGIWWTGKEYAESLRKYFNYKFDHRSMKRGTKRAYRAARKKTKTIRNKAKEKTRKIRENTRIKTQKLKETTKNKLKKR